MGNESQNVPDARCPACNAAMAPGAVLCIECGHSLKLDSQRQQQHDPLAFLRDIKLPTIDDAHSSESSSCPHSPSGENDETDVNGIRCPACNVASPPGANFCAACGHSLHANIEQTNSREPFAFLDSVPVNPAEVPRFAVLSEQSRQRMALNYVNAPALALAVIAALSAICQFGSISFSLFELSSGLAEKRPAPKALGVSKETVTLVRIGMGVVLLIFHCSFVAAALNMKRLEKYEAVRAAVILSLIPCLSPCFLLGIPFGFWALVTLGKPIVRESFKD